MRRTLIASMLLFASMGMNAQSSDANYPMGNWQTKTEDNANVKYYVIMEIFRETSSDGSCGSLRIDDYDKDVTLYEAMLTYVGKELNGFMGNGTYIFNAKSEKGSSTLRINASRTPMITATGELKDHPALKQEMTLCPGAWIGTGGNVFGMYSSSEKELIDELREAVKDQRIPTHGFGNLQQYINAHATLDPTKPKFAKPKGTGAINIREKASTTAAKIGELKPGQTLPVIDEYNGWCQVMLSEKEFGWVSLSVVTLTNVEGKSAMEHSYPALVDGHVSVLGISLGEKYDAFCAKLLEMGFKKGEWSDENNTNLKGEFHGAPSLFRIEKYANTYRVIIYNDSKKPLRLAQAKQRYKELVKKMESIYGKGVEDSWSTESQAKHTIKVDKGTIIIEFFNEDELEGASDYYIVSALFQDFVD